MMIVTMIMTANLCCVVVLVASVVDLGGSSGLGTCMYLGKAHIIIISLLTKETNGKLVHIENAVQFLLLPPMHCTFVTFPVSLP